jgi:hypothetical protein
MREVVKHGRIEGQSMDDIAEERQELRDITPPSPSSEHLARPSAVII